MSNTPVDPTTPSDAELISAVRAGDNDAYGELFERHREAARRMASQLVSGPDADDLVSEAFIRVFDQLRAGSGPDVAFRAYLLTAIRRLHVDRYRAERRVQPSDDLEKYDSGVEFDDPSVAAFESSAAAKAFSALPERWQLVLWHLDVEGAKPADIAPMLGMTANGVSALAYRAREGLRQSYLQLHLADTADEQCRWTTEHLGAYVRSGLGKRDSAKVREHLDECPRCTAVYLELVEVNSGLRGLLAPVLLGAVGLAYVADARAHAAVAATGAGGTGWFQQGFSRTRDWVTAGPAHGLAAAGVTVGVIGAAVVSSMVLASLVGSPDPAADNASDPPALTLPAPSASGEPTAPTTQDTPEDRLDNLPTGTTPQEPGVNPPGADQPGADQPGSDNPGADNPGADGPGADDPGTDNPGTDNPGTDNPGTDNPGTDNPGTDNPGTDNPGTDNPGTDPDPDPDPDPVPDPPGAPAGLAIADGPDGVTLSWGAVEGADGYEVYRTESGAATAAGGCAVAALSTGIVSGPDLVTATTFVDTDAPNGGQVVYEVVAVNDGGSSDAAVLGPVRLPSNGILSVTPLWSNTTMCVEIAARGGRPTVTSDCGDAQRWRVWDDGSGSAWVTLRAIGGPAAGLCLTSASTPVLSTLSMSSCSGATRQQWGLDPVNSDPQQIASRSRADQVLDTTIATLGGPILAVPRIGIGALDDNQRFTFAPSSLDQSAAR